MAASNLMCETAHCGEPAMVFVFREAEKVKACKEHSASFFEKGMHVIEIAGHDFISNPQDETEYHERKELTIKGRGNSEALITICEKELEEAHQAIDSEKRKVMLAIESRFEEIKLATAEIFTQVKAQLEELQANVEQFVRSKENQLSPAARLVCTDLTVEPKLLKFDINDVSDHISAELNDSWAVVPTDLCKRLSRLNASQIAALNEATMEVETQIAKIAYCHQGKFSAVEQILYDFYYNSALQNRPPKASMSLCNDLLEVYFARAEYQEIKSSGLSMLQNYQAANLSAEQYWTTLLYVTYSMRQLEKHQEASEAFGVWRNRIGQSGTKLARMLRLLTSGIDASFSENRSEAEECLQQALRIGISHYPTSTFTALACFRLTVVCEKNAREQHHLLTKSLYEVISPKCAHAALNLTSMGFLLFNEQRPKEAEEKVNQAQSILEIAAPESIHAGKNFTILGMLRYEKKQWKEAEWNMKKAESILNNAAPNSVDAAINYFYMGMLSEENSRKEEAIERYSKAAILYEINGKREKQLEIEEKIARLKRQCSW